MTIKIDFHVHTNYSLDSIIRPEELAKKANKLGIIPVITDHNTIDAHRKMRSLGAHFLPGEEIRTDRGDLIGIYLNEVIAKKTPFLDALDQIRDQGGIAYLPHMYDTTRKGVIPDDREIKKIDIIEVFNARCLRDGFNEKAATFANKQKKLKGAASDSHFLFEFGNTYTELPEFDTDDPRQLLKALKNAKLTTKKAPFFIRGPTTVISMGKKLLRSLGLNKIV